MVLEIQFWSLEYTAVIRIHKNLSYETMKLQNEEVILS